MSAPLLTPKLAQMFGMKKSSLPYYEQKESNDFHYALLALAAGQTVCVPVLDEAGHRAAFEAWWCSPDHDEAPGFQVHKQFAREAYLACARANGLVKS